MHFYVKDICMYVCTYCNLKLQDFQRTPWQFKLPFPILAILRRLQQPWGSVCMSCHCTKIYRIVFGKRLMLCCRNMTASLLKRHPGDGIFNQIVSGKPPFLKNITNTRHTALNAAMTLGDLSLLHINWQSKLIIRTYHNLPDFSAREFLSSLSLFCWFNFNILYRIHTAFRICILMSIHLILFYIYVTILTFFP